MYLLSEEYCLRAHASESTVIFPLLAQLMRLCKLLSSYLLLKWNNDIAKSVCFSYSMWLIIAFMVIFGTMYYT